MKISIIAVGKIKEKYLKDGINDYLKRISRFAKIEVIEIKEQSELQNNMNDGQEDIIKNIEGDRIIGKLDNKALKILLDIKGEKFDSMNLAKYLNEQFIYGKSHIIFILGGSNGVSENVKKEADLSFSFSDLTFPHQLMRLILLEQIYRSFKIINNETYHK